jgi:sigma-B regulation protein RsbU (phosphoserine phosphatase)
MTYANAGHNPPLWYRSATGQVEALRADGIVLGVLDDISLEQKTIHVEPGDVLAFYTDGVTESMNGEWQEFGEQRLIGAIQASVQGDASSIMHQIVDEVNDFSKNVDQSDDFTLFVVKRL